jgi:hypothetical protein
MNNSQQAQGMQKPQGAPPSQGSEPPSKEDMYAKFDTDGDSYISETEMASVLSMGQSEELSEEGLSMFADADVDGDGKLSQEEFDTQMESMRDEMGPPPGGAPGAGEEQMSGASISTSSGVDMYSLIQNVSGSTSSYTDSLAVYA